MINDDESAKFERFPDPSYKVNYNQQIECMQSSVQQPCKFNGTKESVYIRKELNVSRIGLVQQHGYCFIKVHQVC